MRLNVVLQKNYGELLQVIREYLFPGAGPKEVRDSYVVNWVIDNFEAGINVLEPYLKEGLPLADPKMFTISAGAWNKIHSLGEEMGSLAAALRTLLDYSVSQIKSGQTTETPPPPLTAAKKTALKNRIIELQDLLAKAEESLEAIKAIVEEQET